MEQNDITLSLPRSERAILLSALVNIRGVPFASKPNVASYHSVIDRLKKLIKEPDAKVTLTPCEAHDIILGIRAFAEEFGKNVSTYTNYQASELLSLANKLEDVLPKVGA